jgi:DNA repair protein SbcC/Rad50
MITRLELTNFRRHRHSVIDLDPASRLILIEGGNGAGKSTVVEAVLWALYGEGRDGRGNLDTLVRRGGEDEGMQVILTFTRGEWIYTATRARRRGHSSATLTLDGAVMAALPSSVTAEITTLLGVDAAGFRLATYAQQKELDALASLQPARRGQMLARLLGVDAVAAARGDATADARAARTALAALGAGDDLDDLTQRLERARSEHDQYAAQLTEIDSRLGTAGARLGELAEAEAAWQARRRSQLVAVGAADQLQARRRQLSERLTLLDQTTATLDVQQARRDAAQLEQLEQQQTTLRDRLETARRDRELVERRRQLQHDADQLHRELGDLIDRCDRARADAAALEGHTHRHRELAAALAASESTLAGLRDLLSATQARLDDAEHACALADAVGDTCDTCGQEVTADVRDQLHHARVALADQLRGDVGQLRTQVDACHAEVAGLRRAVSDAAASVGTLQAGAAQLDDLTRREAQTLARRQQLEAQVERLPSHADDPEPLAVDLIALDGRLRAAREQSGLEHQRQELASQLAQVDDELGRLDTHQSDPALERAHLEHADLDAERSRLGDLRHRVAQAQAVAGERVAGAAAAHVGAQERAQRRRVLERDAQDAAAAASVLEEVTQRLTDRIRPALEAEVSQMLDRLSEGRYSSVRLDDNYDLWVADDGGLQPLASLSGGEIDLVALAVRLALAAVVADRNATQGPEFLILDECFGSQDPSRQRAIVAALRQLDGVYQQVFVISHVPGVRDEVDRVIEVAASITDEVRTAEIL